ncbi:MAG: mandelate racemase/muconate lactonizing enzyme family protein [Armatimonadota bacterium]
MRIEAVRAATLRIPLDAPVIVGGGLRISEREYLLVALTTDAGMTGVGWSFTRGMDLAHVARRHFLPLLEGEDPLEIERLWEKMDLAAHGLAADAAGLIGSARRVLSALDIALWDLKGQVAGLPLHRLLGGYRTEVPVLMAGMYYTAGRRPEDDTREAAGYVEQGFRMLKMMGGVAPFAEDLARVRAVREAVGSSVRIALDVNGAWRDQQEATANARALADLDVAFVEEPLPAEDLSALQALTAASPVPIAMGETASGRRVFRDLITGGAHILRPDATVVGGISEWMKVHAMAVTWSVRVIPHYFPDVHIHMAAAFVGVEGVECVTTAGGISNFHYLVREPLRPSRGVLRAPGDPGLGLHLDWAAVERYTVN